MSNSNWRGNKGGGMPIKSGLVWTVVLLLGLGAVGVIVTESLQPAGIQSSHQNTGEYVSLGTGALAVSEERADLGRVPLNTMATHTFRLRNISDQQVTIGPVAVSVLEGC